MINARPDAARIAAVRRGAGWSGFDGRDVAEGTKVLMEVCLRQEAVIDSGGAVRLSRFTHCLARLGFLGME